MMYEDNRPRTGHGQTDNKQDEPNQVKILAKMKESFSFSYKTQAEEVSVLEALAASGLRSIRYALEVPAVSRVVANDLSSEAYESMCRNIAHNSVEGKVVPSCQEARYIVEEIHTYIYTVDVRVFGGCLY